jgi:peptidoglycan/xylan/chitin deacetylase (PgdA/CDA1 family)
VRQAVKDIAWAGARVVARFPRSSRPRAMILGYHHVNDEGGPMTVSVGRFQAQARWLASSGLATLDVGEVGGWLAGASAGARAVAITFDDGYLDTYSQAAPILAEAGLRSTVYVPSDYVGQPDRIQPHQAGELAAMGMTVGSHSRSHADLRRCTDAELDEELRGSRTALEDVIGRAVLGFAYPYGLLDDRIAERTAAAGYTHAVTTHRGWTLTSSPSYRLPRDFVDDYDETTFAAVVGGGLHYLAALDRPVAPRT